MGSAILAGVYLVNLLSLIFAQVYFPTCSNSLKEVGAWIGCKWSCANSSGVQAIVWRHNWEQWNDPATKQKLITYNAEDCESLQVLSEVLVRLCSPDTLPNLTNGTDPAAVLAESSSSKERLLRHFTTPITDFDVINKAARWDFQRDRVYIRTDKSLKHAAAKKLTRLTLDKSRKKQNLPVNQNVTCEPLKTCPFCGNKPDKQHRPRKLLLYDLRFSKSGIKRWIVQYRFCYYWCNSCKKQFGRPEGFWPKSDFGRNFVAFVIYQTIDLCLPQMTAARSIRRLFALRIGNSTVSNLKANAAHYYAETRLSILASFAAEIAAPTASGVKAAPSCPIQRLRWRRVVTLKLEF